LSRDAKGITSPTSSFTRSLTTCAAATALDDEDVRALGSRLAEDAGARRAENLESAERFTEEHRETFDRLAG
jgi:hypothetical protein